jgi:3-phenylpropionate/trans-cinnamate dioxygenase ferredoxin reductase subunit
MITRTGRTILWVSAYLLLALGPLAILFVTELPPPRGFWIEFSAALGFIALAMFALQFVLTARFKGIASPHGLDTILQFHREAGLVAVAFALMHPITMILSAPPYIEFLDPRVMFPRAAMLIAVIAAMLLIVFLTLRRQPLGIPYEVWRLSHGLLGLFIVVIGLVHILQVNWYVAETWKRTLWIGLTVGALLLLGHVRIVKPFLMRRRPYRVAEVRSEGGRTWTVVLEPAGHGGMKFKPGQFAWLTLGPTPFSMQQHPFSFSSSAVRPDRLEFTIRELGDFTSTIGRVKAGTTAFLEGPYGAFVPVLSGGNGLVLIAGGVGIAPMMSLLRTLRDMKDQRTVLLIYGSRDKDETIFRDELESLRKMLRLQVVFVQEQADDSLSSESGLIREELLETYLPGAAGRDFQYFICGPVPMMDMAERYLARAGVPHGRIHSERFDIA